MDSAPPAEPAWRGRLGVALLLLALLGLVIAVITAGGTGTGFSIGPLRVSIHTPTNPALGAIIAGLIAYRLLGKRAASVHLDRLDQALTTVSPLIAAGFAAFVLTGTIVAGVFVAGGSDSAGYLSEAGLFRTGGFMRPPLLANPPPLAAGIQPLIPLGYRMASTGTDMAPVYPPGFPMWLALAEAIAGEGAAYYVVPIFAAGLVLLAYTVGRRLGGPQVGAVAAAATAVSPTMLFQAVQPMSDVPAAFWWTLSFLLLTAESVPAAFAAGAAAAAAGLIRPNLFAMVPVAAALAVSFEHTWSRGIKRAAAFLVPALITAAGFAAWQRWLYGSTTETGYGGMTYLFSPSHVLPNLQRYPGWLIDTHSVLIVAALAAPFLLSRGWASPALTRDRAVRVAWGGLAMFTALLGFYTLYLVFEDWPYTRFLLPALPPVFCLAALAVLAVLRRASGPLAGAMTIALLLLVASSGFVRSRVIGVFNLRDSEHRYLDIANFARDREPSAVFATMMHSGSLHHYTARPILRWDWLDPAEIDRAMDALRSAGHAVYVVLDDWEEPGFRSRFAGTRTLASLGLPLMTTTSPSIHTSVYRLGP